MLLTIKSGTMSKAHSTDAGLDIHSAENITIPPYDSASISTNLIVQLPTNSLAFAKPRSGSSFKCHIETGAGVIDETYDGEIKIKLYNNGADPFNITHNQKIAQLVILERPIVTVQTINDAIFIEPEDAPRGDNGFGSTDSYENKDMNLDMDSPLQDFLNER